MGQNFSSEPVVEKETERDHNDTFNVAVSSCQGWRMSQEDNHSLILDLQGEHKGAFFAVYDGHGSARVSKHASESLWRHLVENDMYIKGNFKEALESAFLTFDREVNESYNAQLAGTTAVCLLIVDNIIYCANIGDSRGVACVNCECVPLSYDHKPENPQELKRILAAGGYVLGNRVNGNLALSRAFGDFHYKGNEQLPPEQQIVSPCPDIKMLELSDDVDFLVLACDGIWDVLSNEEVVEFVIARLEESMELGLICEQLTTRCLATDYELVIGCDNMTVLLICYTRGRSWIDYCTDIFNKNTRRIGVPRTRPTVTATTTTNLDTLANNSNNNANKFQRLNTTGEYYDILNVLSTELDARGAGSEESSSLAPVEEASLNQLNEVENSTTQQQQQQQQEEKPSKEEKSIRVVNQEPELEQANTVSEETTSENESLREENVPEDEDKQQVKLEEEREQCIVGDIVERNIDDERDCKSKVVDDDAGDSKRADDQATETCQLDDDKALPKEESVATKIGETEEAGADEFNQEEDNNEVDNNLEVGGTEEQDGAEPEQQEEDSVS